MDIIVYIRGSLLRVLGANQGGTQMPSFCKKYGTDINRLVSHAQIMSIIIDKLIFLVYNY